MPGFYRKKRRKTGPSKNDEKVARGREALAESQSAGTLSSRFPTVRAIKFRIAVVSPQGVTLDETEDQLGADDAFIVEADCPGRCGSGSYDFSEIVAASVSKLEDHGTAQIACAEPLYGGGPESCGCIAKLEFQTEFAPN